MLLLLGIKNEKKGLATKTPRRERRKKERKKERKKRKGVVVVVSFRRSKTLRSSVRVERRHETQIMWCRSFFFFFFSLNPNKRTNTTH